MWTQDLLQISIIPVSNVKPFDFCVAIANLYPFPLMMVPHQMAIQEEVTS